MKKHNYFFALTILIILALTGCATMPDFTKEIDPLTIFDENATMYAHVKISGNEGVLENLILNNIEGMDEDSLDTILERSHSLYIAVFEETASTPAYIQLALQGSFPVLFVNASLNSNRGWQNHSADIDGSTYRYKQHSTGIELATLSSNLIVLSSHNVSRMQNRFMKSLFNTIVFPVAYDEQGIANSINTLFMNDSSIAFYFPEAKSLISSMIPIPIELAVDYAYASITIIDDENFLLSVQLKMQDERLARGTMTLLSLALLGSNIKAELLEGGIIALSDLPLSATFLEEMF